MDPPTSPTLLSATTRALLLPELLEQILLHVSNPYLPNEEIVTISFSPYSSPPKNQPSTHQPTEQIHNHNWLLSIRHTCRLVCRHWKELIDTSPPLRRIYDAWNPPYPPIVEADHWLLIKYGGGLVGESKEVSIARLKAQEAAAREYEEKYITSVVISYQKQWEGMVDEYLFEKGPTVGLDSRIVKSSKVEDGGGRGDPMETAIRPGIDTTALHPGLPEYSGTIYPAIFYPLIPWLYTRTMRLLFPSSSDPDEQPPADPRDLLNTFYTDEAFPDCYATLPPVTHLLLRTEKIEDDPSLWNFSSPPKPASEAVTNFTGVLHRSRKIIKNEAGVRCSDVVEAWVEVLQRRQVTRQNLEEEWEAFVCVLGVWRDVKSDLRWGVGSGYRVDACAWWAMGKAGDKGKFRVCREGVESSRWYFAAGDEGDGGKDEDGVEDDDDDVVDDDDDDEEDGDDED